MLWYKAWLDTRSRFLIGLLCVVGTVVGMIAFYPRAAALTSDLSEQAIDSAFGGRIAEMLLVSKTYRGYVWSQVFYQNLPTLWCLFAALLGTGGWLSASRGGLFTLSLPVSRRQLVATRAGIVLLELLVLAIVPALLIPFFSPAVGQSYSIVDATVHALCLFIGGSVFFGLAFLLSSVFDDVWRPALVAIGAATILGWLDGMGGGVHVFRVITAENYFFHHSLPWTGLLLSALMSTAMVYGATVNVARRDF